MFHISFVQIAEFDWLPVRATKRVNFRINVKKSSSQKT